MRYSKSVPTEKKYTSIESEKEKTEKKDKEETAKEENLSSNRIEQKKEISLTKSLRIENFAIKELCTADFPSKTEIARGQYGVVYTACRLGKCDVVIKETSISTPMDLVTSKIDAILIKALQGTYWQNASQKWEPLVPRYFDSWLCNKSGVFVLVIDKWDGDMFHKSRKRYDDRLLAEVKPISWTCYAIYTQEEIDNMFRLASRMDFW